LGNENFIFPITDIPYAKVETKGKKAKKEHAS
jgi:hypothetical protein